MFRSPCWRCSLGVCVLRGGSLRSIMLRLTISGSMYLDYSKRHWRLALRRNNAANGRVEARMLAGSSLQWFGKTDQGEGGEITGPCTMRTSSIDVPSISCLPPSKSSLDAGVKYSCKDIYVSSTNLPTSLPVVDSGLQGSMLYKSIH